MPGSNAAYPAYRLEITNCRLYVEVKEVTPALSLSHELMARQKNFRFPLEQVAMKVQSIPNGVTAHAVDSLYSGTLPDLVIFGLVKDTAYSGNYGQNPFNFDHFRLSEVSLIENGKLVTNKALEPDFTGKRYLKEYESFLKALHRFYSERAITINRSEYGSGYTLFAFDLTPDKSAGLSQSVPRTGSIRLELKFAAATAQTISVITYGLFRNVMEIDKDRNVIFTNT